MPNGTNRQGIITVGSRGTSEGDDIGQGEDEQTGSAIQEDPHQAGPFNKPGDAMWCSPPCEESRAPTRRRHPTPVRNNGAKCSRCSHKPGYMHSCNLCDQWFCPGCLPRHHCPTRPVMDHAVPSSGSPHPALDCAPPEAPKSLTPEVTQPEYRRRASKLTPMWTWCQRRRDPQREIPKKPLPGNWSHLVDSVPNTVG